MVVFSWMKARMDDASDRDGQVVSPSRHGGRAMILRVRRRGLRRAARTARRSSPPFLGVQGGPHVTGGCCDSSVNLANARTLASYAPVPRNHWISGVSEPNERSSEGGPLACEDGCHRTLRVPFRGPNGDTGHYRKKGYCREVPLRRITKKRQRFNPGRCHDCDLRFSFPQSSRHFLSSLMTLASTWVDQR